MGGKKMKSETRLKLIIAVLAVILAAVLGLNVWGAYKQSQIVQLQSVANQGYNIGVSDALATAYQQTSNCQVTTLSIGNATRRIVDFDCVQQALAQQQAAAQAQNK
jgi:hypothetical protein